MEEIAQSDENQSLANVTPEVPPLTLIPPVKYAKKMIVTGVVLYLVSLCWEVARYGNHVSQANQYYDPHLPICGVHALLLGLMRFLLYSTEKMPMGDLGIVFHEVGILGWFANPLSFLALIFLKSRVWSSRLASLALVLSTLSMLIIGIDDPFRVLGDPDSSEPLHLMGGSFVWYGSILLLWLATEGRRRAFVQAS